MPPNSDDRRIGLILSGGGARAAYQVGVLQAIAALIPRDAPNPFQILCGTSAGALNATTLAIYATRFRVGVARLAHVWRNFRVHKVYRADLLNMIITGGRWLAALLLGGIGRANPHALLDRAPLRALLEQWLPCHEIQRSIDAGALYALSVTCSGYSSGQSVTFFQGAQPDASWKRVRRVGVPTRINIDHLMASSAIPFVFEPVLINREYFGDGSMRQGAPISPALHLGADRVFVIGVRHDPPIPPVRPENEGYPSLGQIAGHVLNSIFLDTLDTDIERLNRINKTVGAIPAGQANENGVTLRQVDVLVVSPSQDPDKIAARHIRDLPLTVHYLLRGLGAYNRHGSNLVSYLLFERSYCRALMALGYADVMARRSEILEFLNVTNTAEVHPSARVVNINDRS